MYVLARYYVIVSFELEEPSWRGALNGIIPKSWSSQVKCLPMQAPKNVSPLWRVQFTQLGAKQTGKALRKAVLAGAAVWLSYQHTEKRRLIETEGHFGRWCILHFNLKACLAMPSVWTYSAQSPNQTNWNWRWVGIPKCSSRGLGKVKWNALFVTGNAKTKRHLCWVLVSL